MSLFQTILARPSIKKHAARFVQIVTVLGKYGIAGWIHEGHPRFVRARFKGADGEALAGLPGPVRWRMALADLGPTFIKLGQMLSTRPDLVGPEMAGELEKLQSDTPPDRAVVVRRVIAAELGRPVEDLFAAFENSPFASASIGQVHRARMADGTEVVVKVQHDGIEETVRTDLDIMGTLAEFAAKYDANLRLYQPTRMVAEFRRSIYRELDFRLEAEHSRTFAENFENACDPDGEPLRVHFPRVFPNRSSRRVLTMEYLQGTSVADPEALATRGFDPRSVAKTALGTWIKMILEDGFFHADPRAGNLVVLDDGRLGILDGGRVGRVDDQTREHFDAVVLAVLQRDPGELTDAVLRIATAPPDLDRTFFRAEINDFCGDTLGTSIEKVDVQRATNEIHAILRRYRIVLPSGMAQLIRALALLEGTSRALTRDFGVLDLLEPHAERIARRRFSPEHVFR
ncbi:MAG: ABC1 kinase family protein, partial [Planctomycetota bacterium]